jgi:hypothetical protein
MRTVPTLMATLFLASVGTTADAAPCSGFDDVDSIDPFCRYVDWIKNRSVTLGCTASGYCPSENVTRLQMAAFMNRLGTALTPHEIKVQAAPGGLDLDTNVVTCQSAPFVVTAFPRTAYLDLAFAGHAPAAVDLAADLVVSLDNGGSWTLLTALPSRGSVPANAWGNMSNLATVDLDVGDEARFGVRVQRVSGTENLSDSRCTLRVLVISRDGAAAPF